MHPLDDSAFAELILSEEEVRLVDGPIWKNERPRAFQSIKDIKGTYWHHLVAGEIARRLPLVIGRTETSGIAI